MDIGRLFDYLGSLFNLRNIERALAKAETEIAALEKENKDLKMRLEQCEKEREILAQAPEAAGATVDPSVRKRFR